MTEERKIKSTRLEQKLYIKVDNNLVFNTSLRRVPLHIMQKKKTVTCKTKICFQKQVVSIRDAGLPAPIYQEFLSNKSTQTILITYLFNSDAAYVLRKMGLQMPKPKLYQEQSLDTSEVRTKTGVSVEPAPTCDLEIQTRQKTTPKSL